MILSENPIIILKIMQIRIWLKVEKSNQCENIPQSHRKVYTPKATSNKIGI